MVSSGGIVSYSEPQVNPILSPIVLRPKNNGTYRLIFNLNALNDSVVYHHFELDTLEATLPLISPGCYMTSLDLKDAHYSIPIAPEQQHFLEFYVERHPFSIFVSTHGVDINIHFSGGLVRSFAFPFQCRSKGNISGGARERRRREALGGVGVCSPRKF